MRSYTERITFRGLLILVPSDTRRSPDWLEYGEYFCKGITLRLSVSKLMIFFFNDILTLEVNHQIERIISLFQDSDLSNHFVISLMAPSLALDISLTFPDF